MISNKKYLLYIVIFLFFSIPVFHFAVKKFYCNEGMYNPYGSQRLAFLTTQAMQVNACDILIIGDSLVDGMYFQSNKATVFLAGVGGSRTQDWVLWLPKLLQFLKPQHIIIAVGVNDTAYIHKFNIEMFKKNYIQLCALAEQHDIPNITLSSVLPVGKKGKLGEENFDRTAIKKINTFLQNLANSTSYLYLDCYNNFVDKKGFMPAKFTTDGVHLTTKGYSLWKTILFKNI